MKRRVIYLRNSHMIQIDGWRVHEGNNIHNSLLPPSPFPICGPIGLVFASEYFLPLHNRTFSHSECTSSNSTIGPKGSVTPYCRAQVVSPTPKVVLAVVVLYHLVLKKAFVVKVLLQYQV